MPRRLFRVFNREYRGLHEAALLLGLSAFSAQLLALVRDRMLASSLGAGPALDVYYAAFRLPDFIYVIVGSFVSINVLVPFISEKLSHAEGKKETRDFLGPVTSFFIFSIAILSLLSFIVLPYVAHFLVPGFTASQTEQFITLARILLLSPIFLGLSNILGSLTQSVRQFFVYALSPILYNLGIILGLLFLYPTFGLPGIVWGVVLGALMHALVQLPTVIRASLWPRRFFNFGQSEIVRIAFLSLPRTLALGTQQIMIMVLIATASGMAAGSISVFNFAYNLQSVPLSLIGVSYSVAAFPTLSRLFAEGERKKFTGYIATAMRHIVFWTLPVISLFIILRAQIVRTLYGAGQFTWENTRLVAAAFALFVISLAAQSLIMLLVRGYYAAGKTAKPLSVNIISLLITIFLAPAFVFLFQHYPQTLSLLERLLKVEGLVGTNVLALPLAFSVGSLLNLSFMWALFKRDFKEHIPSLKRTTFESILAAISAGVVSFYGLRLVEGLFDRETVLGIFLQGFSAGILGISVAIIILILLGNREILEIQGAFRHHFRGKEPIMPSPDEGPGLA
jgi:putative peptidoglycan lipid II flippase